LHVVAESCGLQRDDRDLFSAYQRGELAEWADERVLQIEYSFKSCSTSQEEDKLKLDHVC